jgi:hypothetical protein
MTRDQAFQARLRYNYHQNRYPQGVINPPMSKAQAHRVAWQRTRQQFNR